VKLGPVLCSRCAAGVNVYCDEDIHLVHYRKYHHNIRFTITCFKTNYVKKQKGLDKDVTT
jgi:hypothetical protein